MAGAGKKVEGAARNAVKGKASGAKKGKGGARATRVTEE